MTSTAEVSTVPSALRDFREVPLADMPALDTFALDKALARAKADASATPVPVAAFQSAI
jgi:FXSXX-COOH protein